MNQPFTSLLKVNSQSKALLESAKNILLSHENPMDDDSRKQQRFTLAWQLRDFLRQSLPVLVFHDGIEFESRNTIQDSPRRDTVFRHFENGAAADGAAVAKKGRGSSPNRLHSDKNHTIASETLSTLLLCLRAFNGAHNDPALPSTYFYWETHCILWQAVTYICTQTIPPHSTLWTTQQEPGPMDHHRFWNLLDSNLQFFENTPALAARVEPPKQNMNDVFRTLLVIAHNYFRLIPHDNKDTAAPKHGENVSLAMAQNGIMYVITMVHLFLPSCMTSQQHWEKFVFTFLETVVLPFIRHSQPDPYNTAPDELELRRILVQQSISIQFIQFILACKHYAILFMASPDPHTLEKMDPHEIQLQYPRQDLNLDLAFGSGPFHCTDMDSNSTRTMSRSTRGQLHETLVELLYNCLVGHKTYNRVQERICSCLILLFDQRKTTETQQHTQRKLKGTAKNNHEKTVETHAFDCIPAISILPNQTQRPYATNVTLLFRWIVSVVKCPLEVQSSRDSVIQVSQDTAKDDPAGLRVYQPNAHHDGDSFLEKSQRFHINKSSSNRTISRNWCGLTLLLSLIKDPGHDPIAWQFWNTFFPSSLDQHSSSLTYIISLPHFITSEETLHEAILALTISREYLRLLPSRLLITYSHNHGHLWTRLQSSLQCLAHAIRQASSSCLLARTIYSSLHDILNSFMMEASHIIRHMVTTIPFNSTDESGEKSLLGSIMALLEMLGQCVVESLTGDDGLECHIVKTFILDLCQSMGGAEQPDGTISPIPMPTRLWIWQDLHKCQRNNSIFWTLMNYTQFCLNSKPDENLSVVMTEDRFGQTRRFHQDLLPRVLPLMINIVRVSLTTLLQTVDSTQDEIVLLFLTIACTLVVHPQASLRLHGTQLIQAILKSDLLMGESNAVTIVHKQLLPKLSQVLEDDDLDIKRCTLNIIGSLTIVQWEWVITEDGHNIFHRILSFCLEYSGPMFPCLRSDACKAMGNCISTFLAALKRETPTIVSFRTTLAHLLLGLIDDAIQVSVSSLDDSDAEVRSMALFSIGNIAFAAISEHISVDIRERLMSKLKHASEVVARRLDDSSDKVIGNAIRTIGHVVHALSLCDLKAQDVAHLQTLCGDITVKLATRINVALKDLESHNTTRTWKQRNFSKKHAWGSCTSLAPMLLFCTKFGSVEYRWICVEALLLALECIKFAHAVHEKIASCAVSTCLLINKDSWLWISDMKPVLGICIANCLYQFNDQAKCKVLPKALVDDIMVMMKKGLHTAFEINDETSLTKFLNSDILSSMTLDYFYQWMVQDGSFGSSCFDCLGNCLLHTDNADNVSLVQKFFSRAAFISRMGGDHPDDDEL